MVRLELYWISRSRLRKKTLISSKLDQSSSVSERVCFLSDDDDDDDDDEVSSWFLGLMAGG